MLKCPVHTSYVLVGSVPLVANFMQDTLAPPHSENSLAARTPYPGVHLQAFLSSHNVLASPSLQTRAPTVTVCSSRWYACDSFLLVSGSGGSGGATAAPPATCGGSGLLRSASQAQGSACAGTVWASLQKGRCRVSPSLSCSFCSSLHPRQQVRAPPEDVWCFATAHSVVSRPPSCTSTAHCAEGCRPPQGRLSSAAPTQPCCLALPIESQPGIFRFSSAPPASTTGVPGSHVPSGLERAWCPCPRRAMPTRSRGAAPTRAGGARGQADSRGAAPQSRAGAALRLPCAHPDWVRRHAGGLSKPTWRRAWHGAPS